MASIQILKVGGPSEDLWDQSGDHEIAKEALSPPEGQQILTLTWVVLKPFGVGEMTE